MTDVTPEPQPVDPRATLVRISSAVAVQMNGLGLSLWAATYSSILAIRSGTEWNVPRRNALSVSCRPAFS